jgi:hypothetical protein
LLKLGDLVENFDCAGVVTLGEEELGRLVESEDGEAEEEDDCGRGKGGQSC